VKLLRAAGDCLIYLFASAFVILGLFEVIYLPMMGDELSKYIDAGNHAPCPVQQALHSDDCVAYSDATVIRKQTSGTTTGFYAPSITVSWPNAGIENLTWVVNRPTSTFYSLRAGDTVQLKVWNGRPTAVTAGKSASRLYGNPYDSDDLRTVGGISVLAMGLIIFIVHTPQFITTRLAAMARQRHRSWHFAFGRLTLVTRDLQMRIAVLVFLVAQALDVITSIKGGQVQLFEANPLAAALILRVGPVTAFLMIKLVAVIALLLVMARLPRRAALLVVWATSAVFFWVALRNAQLIAGSRLG
jgi:hypothetical protein